MHSCLDTLPQNRNQFGDVDARSSIDVWRVLFGNEIHTHTQMLVRLTFLGTNICLWQWQESLEWSSLEARERGLCRSQQIVQNPQCHLPEAIA